MRKALLPLSEIALIAATRGMLGAGIALLGANRLTAQRRRTVGSTLLAIGVLSTVPLLLDVLRKRR